MRYYERELSYIRKALNDFASRHPQQAAQLKLNQNNAEDPNITRLLDGVALLTAKTEQRLDEQLPELQQDLLSILYPGFLQTRPSYAAIQLQPDVEKLQDTVYLPKGSILSLPLPDGHKADFSTCDELTVYPLVIDNISAHAAPFNMPAPPQVHNAEAVIQLRLACAVEDGLFSQLDIPQLDFYVRGFERRAASLIEILLQQTVGISVTNVDASVSIPVAREHLQCRIADPEFQWLPRFNNQFIGYDLLQDYFAYADKGAYFRLKQLQPVLAQIDEHVACINIFVRHLPAEFLRLFNREVFCLHTVPALNLFESRGEPLRYDFSRLSIPVLADASISSTVEAVAVLDVNEVRPDGEHPLSRLYQSRYRQQQRPQWSSRQRWDEKGRLCLDLSVSHEQGQVKDSVVLSMNLLCSNGRAPCLMQPGVVAECQEAIDLPGELVLLTTPTAPRYPDLSGDLNWRCVALLNANFASLLETDRPEAALKQVLQLFCLDQSCRQADAIRRVEYRQLVAPVQVREQNIFSVGNEITITLETELLSGQVAVFVQLLNGLYQQFCSFDRFVQLKIRRFGSDSHEIEFAKVHGSQLCL